MDFKETKVQYKKIVYGLVNELAAAEYVISELKNK